MSLGGCTMAAGITSMIWTMLESRRRDVKATTKIRLLVMSKAEKEKRLDTLNQKLGTVHPNTLTENDREEMEEREWLKNKLGYTKH
jgi:hypothetical protein